MITNQGVDHMAKVISDEKKKDFTLELSNPPGPVRRYEAGKFICEFPSWKDYYEWAREHHPEEIREDGTMLSRHTFDPPLQMESGKVYKFSVPLKVVEPSAEEPEEPEPLTPEQARKVAALAAFCADELADAPMYALSFVAELFPECRRYAEAIFNEYHKHIYPDHSLDYFRISDVGRQEYLKILEDLK